MKKTVYLNQNRAVMRKKLWIVSVTLHAPRGTGELREAHYAVSKFFPSDGAGRKLMIESCGTDQVFYAEDLGRVCKLASYRNEDIRRVTLLAPATIGAIEAAFQYACTLLGVRPE